MSIFLLLPPRGGVQPKYIRGLGPEQNNLSPEAIITIPKFLEKVFWILFIALIKFLLT
jgi:hypothetical protein